MLQGQTTRVINNVNMCSMDTFNLLRELLKYYLTITTITSEYLKEQPQKSVEFPQSICTAIGPCRICSKTAMQAESKLLQLLYPDPVHCTLVTLIILELGEKVLFAF